jgi:LPS-assembly protein
MRQQAVVQQAQPTATGAIRIPRINQPEPGYIYLRSVTQRREGAWYYLRGAVQVETAELLLRADEIDYYEKDHYAEARGNVRFLSYDRGEELQADRAEYFLDTEQGKFFNVRGSSRAQVDFRPGLLISPNPFVFQGRWAERLKDRYILYDGFVTDCKLPKPWWTLRGSKFDIVPGERAIAYKTKFVLWRAPIVYIPAFYKSLESQPRKSGFLMPSIGNSSRRGKMVKAGYFWAINRSYDVTYQPQLFTQRGLAHNVDFRGKPAARSDFDFFLFGVNDRGLKQDDGERIKQGGYLLGFRGKSELFWGFHGRGEVNYLSSFVFRQAFTESFQEAVFSEAHSRGYLTRQWSTFSLNLTAERIQNFQTVLPGDHIVIRKLPSVEFNSRDKLVSDRVLPIWVSFQSSASLVRRTQPLFQTRQFVDRFDAEPHVMTALRWKEFTLLPGFSLRETHYGSTRCEGTICGEAALRSSRTLTLDLVAPSLARVFGGTVKHVIEPRAGFRWTSGVEDFSRFIRFDETELVSNTREVDYSLTNRIYAKRNGAVSEVFSWQVWQKRYLDPTLGGAIQDGARNVFQTQLDMTAYSYFDGRRRYSPVVSSLRLNPTQKLSVEWRSDYDPARHRPTNSTLLGALRGNRLFVSAGHNHVRSLASVSPPSNQFLAIAGYGREDQRGFGIGFQSVYDFRIKVMQFATTQVSWNSDCCGLSLQYRRFSFGTRNENQWRVAFAVSNLGSFGTLRRQERIF